MRVTKFVLFFLCFIVNISMAVPPEVEAIIKELKLEAYPAGKGTEFFTGAYTSKMHVGKSSLPENFTQGEYCLSSTVYFLMLKGGCIGMHAMHGEKQYHHYAGGPMKVFIYNECDGSKEVRVLGTDVTSGQRPLVTMPSDAYVGAVMADDSEYVLIGCSVTPEWAFPDVTYPSKEEFIAKFPGEKETADLLIR